MVRFSIDGESVQNGAVTLRGEELLHMKKVLRLRPGDRVTLFDDRGWEHAGVIRSYDNREGKIEVVESYKPERESSLEITLAQSLGKGNKLDWVIEQATELGVQTIVPFFSRYTVPKLGPAKTEGRGRRWRKIALSAAKQSGRTRIPYIRDLGSFEDLARRPDSYDLKLIFWERAKSQTLSLLKEQQADIRSILLVIGPEGGFAQEEVALALSRGFQAVSLGKRILRTETTPLVVLSVVQFLWGDLGARE
jgi:16S rRNA (uracil1498-N3)-methyltransferase